MVMFKKFPPYATESKKESWFLSTTLFFDLLFCIMSKLINDYLIPIVFLRCVRYDIKLESLGGNTMEYRENALRYEDYCRLRGSVNWLLFSEEQTRNAIKNSLYTVIAVDTNQTIGMGRLIGDGMYYVIVDIVVSPAYQNKGIGTTITNMIVEYVNHKTPVGGRSSIQLIAEKGKEHFYGKLGFKLIPHSYCGSGMRKVICK